MARNGKKKETEKIGKKRKKGKKEMEQPEENGNKHKETEENKKRKQKKGKQKKKRKERHGTNGKAEKRKENKEKKGKRRKKTERNGNNQERHCSRDPRCEIPIKSSLRRCLRMKSPWHQWWQWRDPEARQSLRASASQGQAPGQHPWLIPYTNNTLPPLGRS